MPKPYTLPSLYDECKTISIGKLMEWDYLKQNIIKSGTITWSRNGEKYASISICVNTLSDRPFIELKYTCNQKPINYKVNFLTTPSNMGRGVIWFFECPITKRRCRKLYMIDTYFLHRTAFKGAMYEKQTYSKHARSEFKRWAHLFEVENIYEKIYSRHFRTSYAGKPTKTYMRLCKRLAVFGEPKPIDI
jgi:hypothetical protein